MKARRLLSSGRLTVFRVDDLGVRARCVGDHDEYDVGWDDAQGWWCSCPALGDRHCSHLVALELVVVRPGAS